MRHCNAPRFYFDCSQRNGMVRGYLLRGGEFLLVEVQRKLPLVKKIALAMAMPTPCDITTKVRQICNEKISLLFPPRSFVHSSVTRMPCG